MKRIPALTLALAAALPATAVATDDVGKWYVTPALYGTWTGSERRVDDDWSYGLIVGRNFSETYSLEASWLRGEFAPDRGFPGDLELNSFSIDSLFHFYRDSRIHPYFKAGLLYMDAQRGNIDTERSGMVQAGIGVMSNLWKNPARTAVISLRGEVKGRWTFIVNDRGQDKPADFLAGLGLQVAFGAAAPLPAVPSMEPAPAPAPVPAEPPPPADSDGDGVRDDADKCSGTATGAEVDANGCELDSDRDGRVDRLDMCPGSPPGAKVDANGCELEELVLRGVNFEFDSATLTVESSQVLDALAETLRQRPGVRVEIRGHTDSRGADAYNQRLSERRAQAVVAYLVGKGIPAASLVARGLGERQPIAPNDTDAGRAENRRVTVQFTAIAQR